MRNDVKGGAVFFGRLPLEGSEISEKTPYSGKPMVLKYFFLPLWHLEKRSVAGSFHLESFLGPTELCQSII